MKKIRLRTPSKRAALTWQDYWGSGVTPPTKTYTGKDVSESNSLKYSVVFRCVSLIADAVSSLDPQAYTLDEEGWSNPAKLPSWIRSPTVEGRLAIGQQRIGLFHQLLVSVLLWGNGYAQLVRRPSDGVIVGFVPVHASRVNCQWRDPTKPGYDRVYQIDGGPWLTNYDVLHVQGLTLPGEPTGLSVIGQAREAIALGLTLEEFGARYFAQGSMAKMVIKHPKTIDDEVKQANIIKNFERFHRGPMNWHRPALLTGGAELEQISIPPGDAQFLESREFQALDAARWFGIPPHRVGIMTKETSWGSGLTEQNVALYQSVYRRYILMFESTFTAYTAGGEDNGVRIRLDDSVLMRGTFKEQVESWGDAVIKQVVCPNEARKALGLRPIEGGDKLVVFMNNGPFPDRTQQPGQPAQQQPNSQQPAQEQKPAAKKPAAKPASKPSASNKGASNGNN